MTRHRDGDQADTHGASEPRGILRKNTPLLVGGFIGFAGVVVVLGAAQYKNYPLIFVGLGMLVAALVMVLAVGTARRSHAAEEAVKRSADSSADGLPLLSAGPRLSPRLQGWSLVVSGVAAIGVGVLILAVADDLRLGLTALGCIVLIGPFLVIVGLVTVFRNRRSARR